MIILKDIKKTLEKKDILRGINLSIKRGATVAIIGPTGAGKTTLLKIINMLLEPTSGDLIIDDVKVNQKDENIKLKLRRKMAFVFQKPLAFNKSVFDNVAYGLKVRGYNKDYIKKEVTTILEKVGLLNHKDQNAKNLSGGETQRVALARALIIKPDILLLDEPTANLDPLSKNHIENLITQIIKDQSITSIITTHDLHQGWRMADKIAVLIDGKILQYGSPKEIFYYPKNKKVAEFVGMENIIEGTVIKNDQGIATVKAENNHNNKPIIIEAITKAKVKSKVLLCIRPEEIAISTTITKTSIRNNLKGKIYQIDHLGPICKIVVDCGIPIKVLITSKSLIELNLHKEKEIFLSFKASSIHVIQK